MQNDSLNDDLGGQVSSLMKTDEMQSFNLEAAVTTSPEKRPNVLYHENDNMHITIDSQSQNFKTQQVRNKAGRKQKTKGATGVKSARTKRSNQEQKKLGKMYKLACLIPNEEPVICEGEL